MKDHSENRTENRTNNCKNQSQNRTTNQTTNEHKHPNQYTKGADDESAKNSTSSRSSNAKNSRRRCPSRLMDHGREPLIFLKSQSPLPSGTVFQCGKQRAFAFYFWFGSNCCHKASNSSSTRAICPVR